MKNIILKALAAAAETTIKQCNNTASSCLSYEPKAPANIKKFKKK